MTRWQANLCLLVAAAIWGSTFAVQHVAMDTIGPMTFTAIRFYLGAIVVAPLALKDWRIVKADAATQANKPVFSAGIWLGFMLTGICLFL
ncbi:MAG: EamA family transporter, partial [Alphaproteobacteria bacterium]|nr:EamA family transporter [Alphaproteobacteria bacterium]